MLATELMAVDFGPELAAEFQDRMLGLVDSGECSAECLFAYPEAFRSCTCRCEGLHHGEIRRQEV